MSYNTDNQDKPKAVVIREFINNGVKLCLTEKGAVTVYKQNKQGVYQFVQSHRPSDVLLHAQELGSPMFQMIIDSPEWAASRENKAKAKEQEKLSLEIAKTTQKAQKYLQAAIDGLKASGMTEEQAKTFLKIA